MSQNVAPLTKIVALSGKKIWGAFWRLLEQKRAVSDSELLNTLIFQKKKKENNIAWRFFNGLNFFPRFQSVCLNDNPDRD